MGQRLIKYPKVQKLFESASQHLNYDLLKVCLQGPADKLSKTIHCQPAIYVVSLAALEMIKEEQPEVVVFSQSFSLILLIVDRKLCSYCRQ